MDINKIKKIAVIFLGCTAGSVLIQLAAPMILAAIISAASFCDSIPALPSGSGKGWRIRLVTAKQDKQREDTAADEYTGETGSGDEAEDESPAPEERADNIPAEQEDAVAIWYSSKGKNQLNRIIASLHSRGIYECWIRKDGICNFRSDRGYRRAGIFHDYPGTSAAMIAKLLETRD